jgi:hypothetical protein
MERGVIGLVMGRTVVGPVAERRALDPRSWASRNRKRICYLLFAICYFIRASGENEMLVDPGFHRWEAATAFGA